MANGRDGRRVGAAVIRTDVFWATLISHCTSAKRGMELMSLLWEIAPQLHAANGSKTEIF